MGVKIIVNTVPPRKPLDLTPTRFMCGDCKSIIEVEKDLVHILVEICPCCGIGNISGYSRMGKDVSWIPVVSEEIVNLKNNGNSGSSI